MQHFVLSELKNCIFDQRFPTFYNQFKIYEKAQIYFYNKNIKKHVKLIKN